MMEIGKAITNLLTRHVYNRRRPLVLGTVRYNRSKLHRRMLLDSKGIRCRKSQILILIM
jgi:hypothetical protein